MDNLMITSILLYRFVTIMRYTSLIFSVEKTFIEIVTTAICEMLCDESDDPLIAVIASPLSVLTTRIARLLLLPLGRPSSAIFYTGGSTNRHTGEKGPESTVERGSVLRTICSGLVLSERRNHAFHYFVQISPKSLLAPLRAPTPLIMLSRLWASSSLLSPS